jgi:Mn2+/Fe2+ NRAMP family transporter
VGRERDRDPDRPDRPVEPDETRVHGNDPDAVRMSGDTDGTARAADGYYEGIPTRNLTPLSFKDMPPPLSLGKVLGPSVILTGLGVGSGEYIIWPFVAANVGIAMLWAAVVGITLQFFLNMEIERYTLATGESAVVGFARYWRPFGLLFCILAIVPFIFPGWATSAVTIASFLVPLGEGAIPYVTIVALIAMGLALTVSPVVYNTIEKAEFFKVGLTIVFLLIAIFAVLLPRPGTLADMGSVVTNFGQIQTSETVTIATLLGAIVFAGAGGALNLVQSNYIRDKGFGMGYYIPRIVSPFTGEEVAEPATGSMVSQDEQNLDRWRGWWRVANIEHFITFWVICIFSIGTFSLIAYATVYGKGIAEAADFTFIQAEGEALKNIVGGWFGNLFWLFGTLSLLLTALAVIDNICRLVADAIKTIYLTNSSISESRLYLIAVWSIIVIGAVILLAGFDAPLVLLVLSAVLNGFVMIVYIAMLLVLNRALPEVIKLKGIRLGIMAVCLLFFSFFAGWLILVQLQGLFGA